MNDLRPCPQKGFTLIELLIALSITALVVVVLFSALGLLGRSEKSALMSVAKSERMLNVDRWLAAKFESMRVLSREEAGRIELFFNGNAAGAMWIAPLPELGDGSGLHVMRVTPQRGEGRADWIVEVLPYEGGKTVLNWSNAKREILLRNITTLQWYYQDGLSGTWTQDWNGVKKYYPSRVKILIGDEGSEWPTLMYTLPGGY